MPRYSIHFIRKCRCCKEDFKPREPNQQYCKECTSSFGQLKGKMNLVCHECQESFKGRFGQMFCSNKCKNQNYNRTHNIPGQLREGYWGGKRSE